MRLPVFKPALAEGMLLGLLAFAVLWRGGKSLEMTWLLAFAAGGLTFLGWMRRREHGADPVPPSVWMAGFAFLAWSVASFVLSSTRNYGLDEILRDTSVFLVFLWVARHSASAHGEMFRRRIVATLAAAIVLACVIGIAVYVLQPVSRFVGTFFDSRFHVDYWPNAWAELVLLCWPVLPLALRGRGRIVTAAVTGFVLGCLLLSYSRGAFLCLMGQLGLWGALMLARGVRTRCAAASQAALMKGVATVLATATVAVCVFLAMNSVRSRFHQVESVAAKATFTAGEGTSSVDERRDFWEQSFALSLEKPLLGWGPYAFRFVQQRLQTGVFATSDHPHNVFLKLAMERGWIASGLFLLFLALVLLPAARRILLAAGGDSHVPVLMAAFIGIAGVIAHNLLDYNLQFVGIVLPLWILLGTLSPSRRLPVDGFARRSAEVLLAMILLVTAVSEGRYLVLSSLGRRAEARGDLPAALRWYGASQNEVFSRDLHLSRAGIAIALRQNDEAEDALGDSLAVNAEDARVWKLGGDLARDRGDDATAIARYDKAWGLGRYNYIVITSELVRLVERSGDKPLIAARKAGFDAVHAAFGRAILLNSHFIDLSDNVEEFQRVSRDLARLYPSDAARYRALSQRAVTHAAEVRQELGDQKQGMLW